MTSTRIPGFKESKWVYILVYSGGVVVVSGILEVRGVDLDPSGSSDDIPRYL